MPLYRKPSILERGVYQAKVVEAEQRRSASGKEMIVVKVQIDVEGKSYHVRDHLMLAGAASWKFESFICAIGEELTDEFQFDPADYVGRAVRVVVEIGDFNGRTENKIKNWLPQQASAAANTEGTLT
jgi:hypothetical protein